MSDKDDTPVETPIPEKIRRLEQQARERSMSLESPGSGPNPACCPDHSGVCEAIRNLREAIVTERQKREQAFTALSGKLDATNEKLGDLNTTVAKWGGIAAFALVVIQITVPIVLKIVGG